MIWVLHPSHRKFIQVLHKNVGVNGSIIITKDDFIAMEHLWNTTTNSMRKHQGLYKIIIRATNNQIKDVTIEQIWRVFKVDDIEAILRKIELKSLCRTIRNTVCYPILKYLPRYIAKQNKVE